MSGNADPGAEAAEPINLDVLDHIPLTARAVLEIGCGTGALGAEYKRRNPTCLYVGVEADETLAARARANIDLVFIGDVEANPTPFGDRRFDCVIYNDGLEHLRDPWRILRAHAALLPEGGALLLCVPNAEHWSNAARLLRGTWAYNDDGLTDRRHLRWFTRHGAETALADAGLTIATCLPRIFDAPAAREFVQALAPALPALRLEPETLLARVSPLQYLFVATRGAPAPLTLQSTMLAPVGGVSHVRVIEPLRALASVPGVTTRVINQVIVPSTPETPRILILHRPALTTAAALAPLRAAIAQGYLLICEFDDHPSYIPVLQNVDVHNFSAVHAVQTSTPALAEILRHDNPELAVFPNGLHRLPEIRNHTNPHLTLFFGGLNREEDWPPHLAALNEAAQIAGERLHFRIVGDRALFDALATPHKHFTPICDYETYRALLADSEISFMPLRDNPFNRCKSDLKFIEAAAHRVAALASPTAYGATIEDGRTGLLFRTQAELRDRLLRLVANPALARGLGDAARAYVATSRMNAHQVADRLAWYRALWARKPALDAALAARHPELFAPENELPRYGFDASRL